jgi:nitrate reductase gamma subunit
MSHRAALFAWLVLPYASIVVFLAGHWWRYRHDQFGWTTRSSQLLESRLLAWGSNLFHWGALGAIGGHVLGILVPQEATASIGITENDYHYLAAIAGGTVGVICLIGYAILAFRRSQVRRVRVTTTAMDVVVFLLLGALLLLGDGETFGYNVFGSGYNYRDTVGPWFRQLFYDPHPSLMNEAPIPYQVHAALPWLLYAVWPFSRLVHVWSIPFQYVGRPYILYRRRFTPSTR